MRKVMMLAAMLAMVLVAAAPAFAQATGGDVNVQTVDCSQVAAVAAQQGQYGDATAVSGDVASASSADIANELGISVEQVNGCLGGVGNETGGSSSSSSAAAASSSSSGSSNSGGAMAASSGTLPDTGGASLITLGAGALLVAGGLVARRIVR